MSRYQLPALDYVKEVLSEPRNDTYAINKYGYWRKRTSRNIFSIGWSFEKGEYVTTWWYPYGLLGHGEGIWQLLNGDWFINIKNGDTDCPDGFDSTKYIAALKDSDVTQFVTEKEYFSVTGERLIDTSEVGWQGDVMKKLQEYVDTTRKRLYICI